MFSKTLVRDDVHNLPGGTLSDILLLQGLEVSVGRAVSQGLSLRSCRSVHYDVMIVFRRRKMKRKVQVGWKCHSSFSQLNPKMEEMA